MLTGAHRTGKTTLARAFSAKTGIPFVQTGASHVFVEMGLDPRADYPMEIRLEIQKQILKAFEKQCRSTISAPFITDRTPLDFVAYTLADCQRENVPEHLNTKIEQYMTECIDLTNWLFPVLMVVQPGIPLIDEPGKAPASIAYVEHINSIIMGLVVSERIQSAHFYIPRYITEIEQRVNCIEVALAKTNERYKRTIKEMEESGRSVIFH